MGLYSITTRATGTVLTGFNSSSNIFNVDHENHVTHTEPESINSAEEDLTAMQTTTDPFPNGSLSLPASMTDEVERLRYTLAEVKQALTAAVTPPPWYTPMAGSSAGVFLPPTSIRRELTTTAIIPSGSNTLLATNTLIYNKGFTSQSSSGIVAPVTGVYIVGATCGFGNGTQPTNITRVILTRFNPDVLTEDIATSDVHNTVASNRFVTVETAFRFTKGDTFRAFVFQNHGIPVPLFTTAPFNPAIWMTLVAR